jgi:hypothetical protein
MSEQLPPPGEFGFAFLEFMRVMQEAVELPEPPWVVTLREHLGAEPGELPVTAASFHVADRPNLQLALDAVLPDRELVGLSPHLSLPDDRRPPLRSTSRSCAGVRRG